MTYTRKASPFQPVVLFPIETEADKLALSMVHSLYREIESTMDTERNRQQSIGISEIGSDCLRCVARKLSGLYVKPSDPSWKAQVGTFIHAGLEQHFAESKRTGDPWETDPEEMRVATDEAPLYWMERRLQILKYKGLDLGGSCDLFVEGATFGLVDDWKTQGAAKLKKTAAADIGNTYTVQMQTYGLGYELLGKLVTHVVLYALPRDGELAEAKPVLMRYDRQIALDALARLQILIDAAEIIGWRAVIHAQNRAGHCFDCPGYEKLEADGFLDDLTA